jgi:hypothetical protein
MSRSKPTRRTVLRGLLGGSAVVVGLPPLEIFLNSNGTKDANGSALPKRFGLFFWGNGVVPEAWTPPTTGPGWTPSHLLSPLAALTADVTVVTGTRLEVPNTEPHTSGTAGILSGAPLKKEGEHQTFVRPTIDQLVAAKAGLSTRFRSLEFGARPGEGYSYNGPDNLNPPETSPRALFDRVFGGDFRLPGEDVAPDPSLRARRSILDAIGGDASRLMTRLGASDRQRLEQHLEGIRGLERRLARLEENPPRLDACRVPGAPLDAYPDVDGRPQLSAINRAFIDVAVMALACDQTRVVSNFFTKSVSNNLFPGAGGGHHQLTHDELGEQPQVQAICLQIVEEYAHFVRALKAVPEGDGTLLDHMVLVGTTDCSFGRTHGLDEFPLLLAGGLNGALRKGVHYRSTTNENAARVMLSVLRAMDVPAAEFGAYEGRVTEGLGGIEA